MTTLEDKTAKKQPENTSKYFLKFFIPSLLILCIAYFVVLAFDTSAWPLATILNLSKRGLSTQQDQNMANSGETWKNAQNIYEFQVKDIDGNVVEMSKYKDRVLLIVK